MKKISDPFKLIIEAVKIFFNKKNILLLVSVGSMTVPFQIFTLYQQEINSWELSFMNLTVVNAINLSINILYWIISLMTSIAIIYAVKNVVDNDKLSFSEIVSMSWPKILGFLVIAFVIVFVAVGGTILLIVPGVIFGTWLAF